MSGMAAKENARAAGGPAGVAIPQKDCEATPSAPGAARQGGLRSAIEVYRLAWQIWHRDPCAETELLRFQALQAVADLRAEGGR
jgi:hypothetical protein